ncbi:MAG: synthase subunit epsilon [Gammaproteobacteria bacterium]|nr:synthase subunit epsilon [Gammaproteobacteria bacterium]
MSKTFKFEIVSAEKSLFTGEALMLIAQTQVGELGITPGHTQLLASLKPGDLRVQLVSNEEQAFYVSGGILEVQPYHVVVLSDTVVRAEDLDEATILEAKQRAESITAEKHGELEYAKALAELAEASAQLQALNRLRKKIK